MRARKKGRLAAAAFFATLYFLAPVGLAFFVLGASSRAILTAYAIWFSAMAVLILPGSHRWREKAGWVFGLGTFFTTPVILVLVLLLREVGGLR